MNPIHIVMNSENRRISIGNQKWREYLIIDDDTVTNHIISDHHGYNPNKWMKDK